MSTTLPIVPGPGQRAAGRAELAGGNHEPGTNLTGDQVRASATFERWTYKDAAAVVADAVKRMPGGVVAYDTNRLYAIEGDHWQDGRGWAGPDGNEDPAVHAIIVNAARSKFTPVDTIGEVLKRVVTGVLEREAAVSFEPLKPEGKGGAPSDTQAAEAAAVLGLVSAWWDRVRFWRWLRAATRDSRLFTRGIVRLYIAPGDLVTGRAPVPASEDGEEDAPAEVTDAGGEAVSEEEETLPEVTGLPADLTPAEAFAMVRLDAPEPKQAAAYRDPFTHRECVVYLFEDYEASQTATPSAPGQKRKKAEVWFTDPEAPTRAVVRSLTENGPAEEFSLETGGHLPLSEMEGALLITEAVRRLQKALNFWNSVALRIAEAAGFPERYTTNAGPSGIWMPTKPTNGPPLAERQETDGKWWYMHPVPRQLGAATLTELRGFEYTSGRDALGNAQKAITTPGIIRFDPVDPEYAIKGTEHSRALLLESCHQGHVIAAGTGALLSGYSQEQARDDHLKDLGDERAAVEACARHIIGATIGTASGMVPEGPQPVSDEPGAPRVDLRTFLRRFRVVVNAHVNAGPTTPAQQAENRAQVEAGNLPQEEALLRNGVEDVQAALAAIRSDPMYLANLWTKRGTALTGLVAAGADFEGACKVLGIDAAEARSLIPTDTNPTGANPTTNGGVTQ
jgi:hypothetical protein